MFNLDEKQKSIFIYVASVILLLSYFFAPLVSFKLESVSIHSRTAFEVLLEAFSLLKYRGDDALVFIIIFIIILSFPILCIYLVIWKRFDWLCLTSMVYLGICAFVMWVMKDHYSQQYTDNSIFAYGYSLEWAWLFFFTGGFTVFLIGLLSNVYTKR